MSVSLLEVIEAGGYDPTNDPNDARWLLSKQTEFEELISQAEYFLEDPEPEGDFSGASEDPVWGGR